MPTREKITLVHVRTRECVELNLSPDETTALVQFMREHGPQFEVCLEKDFAN